MGYLENFQRLYDTVDKIKLCFEEREKEVAELKKIRDQAKLFMDVHIAKYKESEARLDRRIMTEQHTCEQKSKEFREICSEKFNAEIQGEQFTKEDQLKELREYLSTYSLTIQGLEATRKNIVITAEDQETMEKYCRIGAEKNSKIRGLEKTLSELLAQLKGDDAIRCLASFEYVPGRAGFMEKEMSEWRSMRKETE